MNNDKTARVPTEFSKELKAHAISVENGATKSSPSQKQISPEGVNKEGATERTKFAANVASASGRENKVPEKKDFTTKTPSSRKADFAGTDQKDVDIDTEGLSRHAIQPDLRKDTSAPVWSNKTTAPAETLTGEGEQNKKQINQATPFSKDIDPEHSNTPAVARVTLYKETVAFPAASIELDRDKLRTAASKSNTTDNMSGLEMKAFSAKYFVAGEKSADVGFQEINRQAVIDQIVEARQQMQTDTGRIKITLSPPNLGTVDLDVIVRQNRVEVTMVADQSAVQQLLQSCGDDIKTALQRQDMKVDTFQVLLNNNSPNNEQQPGPGFWTGTQEHTRRGPADHAVEEDDIGIASVQHDIPLQQHKGLVSIFA